MIAIVYCSSNGIRTLLTRGPMAVSVFDSCVSEHFLKFFMACGELNAPVLRTRVNVVLVEIAFFVLKKFLFIAIGSIGLIAEFWFHLIERE